MIRFRRLTKSFFYAFKGLFKIFFEEQNLQIQTITAFLVILLAIWLKISRIEWAIIVLAITLVVLTEVINSAVERVSDVLKPRISNYVKEIKDIMAAAVMLSSIGAVIIGLIIFMPRLLERF